MFKSFKSRFFAAIALLGVGPLALAGGGGGGEVDYSTLTDAIDFSSVSEGVMSAAAALVAVYIIIKGIKLVLGFVRGG